MSVGKSYEYLYFNSGGLVTFLREVEVLKNNDANHSQEQDAMLMDTAKHISLSASVKKCSHCGEFESKMG